MQKKKNGFLVFCFSFLPGAAEMYMGFMKMGFSLLAVFAAAICIVSLIGVPELSVIPAIMYVYSFFHAHNIAGLDDKRFMELKDDYLFGLERVSELGEQLKGKYKKWVAIALIVLGAVMIWRTGLDLLGDYLGFSNIIVKALYRITEYVPRCIIGVVIIVVGIRLIAGKKDEQE